MKFWVALLCLLPSALVMLWLAGTQIYRLGHTRGWWG